MFTKFDFIIHNSFVTEKQRNSCIIEPYYRKWEVFHAKTKVGERLYRSVALEDKKLIGRF